jgi:DNA mismatch endonuclease (patch repair protein)
MPDMSKIRGKNTKPEILVRQLLHANGFRFRLHYRRLPGKPDIVLPKHGAVILVNGCFWHGHDCHIYKPPKKRRIFWEAKIHKNRARDARRLEEYRALGWKTLQVWECSLQGKTKLSLHDLSRQLESWILYDPMDAEISGKRETSY